MISLTSARDALPECSTRAGHTVRCARAALPECSAPTAHSVRSARAALSEYNALGTRCTLLYALQLVHALRALHVLKSFVLCTCCTPWVLCTCCIICTLVCVFCFSTFVCQTKLQIDRIWCPVDWGRGIISRNSPAGRKFFEPWELIQKRCPASWSIKLPFFWPTWTIP